MKPVQSKAGALHPTQDSLTQLRGRSLDGATSAVPVVRRRGQRFERPLIYFRFSPDEFILSVAGSEERYVSSPQIALEKRTRLVKAVGLGAPSYASDDVAMENGFSYSGGLVITDINTAEIAFRYTLEIFIRRVRRGQLPFLRWMKPDLLIHPLHVGSGQITVLEMRTLINMGSMCGVRNGSVYLGPELSDLEVRTGWYVAEC